MTTSPPALASATPSAGTGYTPPPLARRLGGAVAAHPAARAARTSPAVAAEVTGSFKVPKLGRVHAVAVTVGSALRFRVLVRDGRVALPVLTGEPGVELLTPELDAEVYRAACDAAERAELAEVRA